MLEQYKVVEMQEYLRQAEQDKSQEFAGEIPAFRYYSHPDGRDFRVPNDGSITTGYADRKAKGGYKDIYVSKGWQSLDAAEAVEHIRSKQADIYRNAGERVPWEQAEPVRTRKARSTRSTVAPAVVTPGPSDE